MGAVGRAWSRAVAELGGDERAAAEISGEIERRYCDPHRRYHTLRHIETVLLDARRLGEAIHLSEADQAVLALAVCAHDVIYDGVRGDDERASADWARVSLAYCKLPTGVGDRVCDAVTATASHAADGRDDVVGCLLDADLAILAAPAVQYDEYAVSIRAEYHQLDDDTWKLGRVHVLRELAEKPELFVTAAGRHLWEGRARSNLAREIRKWESTG